MPLADAFYALKSHLLAILPFAADALHVHVGLFLFLVVVALGRQGPRRFGIALCVVLAACLVGEVLDVLYDLRAGNVLRWRNGVKDLVNTMLWPTVWAVVGTQMARRQRARRGARADATGAAGFAPSRLSSPGK